MIKKAQSAIELVVLIGFVLFFFTSFIIAIQTNMSDKLSRQDNLAIKEVALTVQDEINLALESSSGYYRTFKLPQKVGSRNYEINIVEEMVYARTTDGKYAIALPVANVTGDVQIGENIIKKENGKIKLNQ